MFLLWWHWLIKLFKFQAHNSKYIICVRYCMFTTPNQVSFHHHLFPLYPLLPPPTPFPSGNHHTVVCVHQVFFSSFFCLILSLFFTQSLSPTPLRPAPLLPLPAPLHAVALSFSSHTPIIAFDLHNRSVTEDRLMLSFPFYTRKPSAHAPKINASEECRWY